MVFSRNFSAFCGGVSEGWVAGEARSKEREGRAGSGEVREGWRFDAGDPRGGERQDVRVTSELRAALAGSYSSVTSTSWSISLVWVKIV